MSFSKRNKLIKICLQVETMSEQLRIDIFNLFYPIIEGFVSFRDYKFSFNNKIIAQSLFVEFFHQRLSSFPHPMGYCEVIEKLYYELLWNEVYDFIEFFIKKMISPKKEIIMNKLNQVLESNQSSYRILNDIVQPIINEVEIKNIENATSIESDKVHNHLIKAQQLYSNKLNPDYENSCLESSKAIESFLRDIFKNKEILSKNVKRLQINKLINQHILRIIEILSHFRGDELAHAKKAEQKDLTLQDALFVHVTSCSFINYLKQILIKLKLIILA
tara:strand:+ start:1461 stop:2285 length:825 start_codon:yes stop_codon:yes gene_type:complete